MARVSAVPRAGPAVANGVDVDTLVRSILFIAVFLSVWISFHPFQSLADPPPALVETGDRLNQIGFAALFVALAAWTYFNEPRRLMLLLRPALTATLAWCTLSVVFSWEPSLAARRFAFGLVIMSIAGMVLLLPKTLRHFSDLIAAAVLLVLVACYLGVLLAPSRAIHQATDFTEPALAGDWRGLFRHKNEAGATMVSFILIGLFVARMRSLALGAGIIVLASIFLACTQSKTAIGMLPLALITSAVVARVGRPAAGIAVALAILVLFNLFSVGSVYFAPVHHLIETVMPDPTFTGRAEIWQFSIEHMMQRPLFGYGFSSFWGTDQVVYGMSERSTTVSAVDHAHNAYLNLALSIGIPGLALAIFWVVVLPIVDFYRQPHAAAARPLQVLFLRICILGVFTSCFESVILQEIGEGWFLFLTSTFGLRYLSLTWATI